jgi:hypothetical protein
MSGGASILLHQSKKIPHLSVGLPASE